MIFCCFLLAANDSIEQNKNQISIGTIDSVSSKVLNEERKIWIHLPRSVQNIGFSQQKYPVVYLLDGDAHFSSVVGMIEELSEINGNIYYKILIKVN